MHKYLLLILLFIGNGKIIAQSFETSFHSLAGTNSQLPFWLWANQLGRYDRNRSTIQNLEFAAEYNSPIKKTNILFESGACFNFLLAEDNNIYLTELFAGLNWKFLQIKAGAFADKELYNGLSASNGNLAYSRNARPHPRIRMGFNRFVPAISDWLSIYGIYEEGLLNDQRFVDDAHLHHKSFYFRLGNTSSLQFTAGLEHYVMWGGTHPIYGELPAWKDYYKYITGSAGGNNSLPGEQENGLGNTYGTYQVEIKREWKKLQTSLYLSHPYEDRSGLEWINRPDNLYGIFVKFNKEIPLIRAFVLEYYYSKHQSGPYHLEMQPKGTIGGRGRDNYFNHGIYRSGVTYHQTAMVSPIFAPIIIEEGMSNGYENNRISGFHLGSNGYLKSNLQWKKMLTYTRNFGRYKSSGLTTYTPDRKQIASLLQIDWKPSLKPIFIGISFAADYGSLYDNGQATARFGSMLSFKWEIL